MAEIPPPDAINADELLARLGGSREVLAQLVPVLKQSVSIWQAELHSALAAHDAERLRRAAHQAKGALLTFAAAPASAAAKHVEELARAGDFANASAAVNALLVEVDRVQTAVAELLMN